MREILFRGKWTDENKWAYGYYTVIGDYHLIVNPKIPESNPRVIPETVGQFTGLLDAKGNKIFEGDILCDKTEFIIETIIVVDWKKDSAMFYGDVKHTKFCPLVTLEESENFIIVGNIHDNPELLGADYPVYIEKYFNAAMYGEESKGQNHDEERKPLRR